MCKQASGLVGADTELGSEPNLEHRDNDRAGGGARVRLTEYASDCFFQPETPEIGQQQRAS